MKWLNKFTALNVVLLLALAFSITGCGTALRNLSPIQPVHNIAKAKMEQSAKPNEDVIVPAVPAEAIAKPVLDKYGMETVGFRIGKARGANMEALTYIFAFDDMHTLLGNGMISLTIGQKPEHRLNWGLAKIRKTVDVIMMSDYPQLFEVQSKQPILTKTQDGITVSIAYWRRPDLDMKYNRGNAFSPFYETEALHQGDKTDVFYVKITNNRNENIIFDVKKCQIIDQGENIYHGLNYKDLDERLLYMARATGLTSKMEWKLHGEF